MTKSTLHVRKLAVTAMLAAIASILMLFDFSIPMLIPSFVKMDISELPALLATFSMGPLSGVAVCLIKNIFNLLFNGSGTGGVGELCNFLLGVAFVGSAGLIYKHKKNFKGAVLASVIGSVLMALFSLPLNYFVTYPIYSKMYGGLDLIIQAYQVIRPSTKGLLECLIIFNLPFTLVKGLIVAVITFFIYKPLSPILHGRG